MGMYLILDHHRADTMWFVEKLSLYLNSMEAAIEDIRRTDKRRIEQVPLLSSDDFDAQREELHLHELVFEKDFSSKLRYSFLILVYTMLETRTKALWQELVDRGIVGQRKFKKRDKKSHLESIQYYLSSEPKVDCVEEGTWDVLLNFEAIRHCFVHTSGNVDEMNGDKPEQLRQIIKDTGGLSINEEGNIDVESIYCRQILSVVERFFDTVFEFAGFGPADTVIEDR